MQHKTITSGRESTQPLGAIGVASFAMGDIFPDAGHLSLSLVHHRRVIPDVRRGTLPSSPRRPPARPSCLHEHAALMHGIDADGHPTYWHVCRSCPVRTPPVGSLAEAGADWRRGRMDIDTLREDIPDAPNWFTRTAHGARRWRSCQHAAAVDQHGIDAAGRAVVCRACPSCSARTRWRRTAAETDRDWRLAFSPPRDRLSPADCAPTAGTPSPSAPGDSSSATRRPAGLPLSPGRLGQRADAPGPTPLASPRGPHSEGAAAPLPPARAPSPHSLAPPRTAAVCPRPDANGSASGRVY